MDEQFDPKNNGIKIHRHRNAPNYPASDRKHYAAHEKKARELPDGFFFPMNKDFFPFATADNDV
jgi:hypothetical protein